MSLESRLAAFLNRRRKKCAKRLSGFYLGNAEALIGGGERPFSLGLRPTRHTFVCGRTGTGKTTLLLRLMSEHLRLKVPFLFIDFHGPATEDLLAIIGASGARQQCVLLEPWSDPVVGWNLFEGGGDSAYGIVQELLAIFHHRLWPAAWGPRIEELLRMMFLALGEAHLTLLESTSFLARSEFRRAVLQRVTMPEVRDFWGLRFERLSPSQRSSLAEAVLNKLSVFRDPGLKYVLGQAHGTLDLDRALESGRTVLANLSTGQLRGNNFLLAALLVAKLKTAVYRRSPGAKPYAVFLDEFQEMIALDALDDYLRSFRKFGCSVYLATQNLQLPPEIKAAVFGNCHRFISFATSASDAAALGREFGPQESTLVAEMLPDLATGEAIAKVRGERARLLRVLPPTSEHTEDNITEGRARCLRLGKSREELDAEIQERLSRFQSARPLTRKGARPIRKKENVASDLPEGY